MRKLDSVFHTLLALVFWVGVSVITVDAIHRVALNGGLESVWKGKQQKQNEDGLDKGYVLR